MARRVRNETLDAFTRDAPGWISRRAFLYSVKRISALDPVPALGPGESPDDECIVIHLRRPLPARYRPLDRYDGYRVAFSYRPDA